MPAAIVASDLIGKYSTLVQSRFLFWFSLQKPDETKVLGRSLE